MKHTIFHLFAAMLALTAVLSGCRAVENEASGAKEIRFTASIGKFDVKATDTAFEDGDLLSLYADWPVNADNVMMTAQSDALIPSESVHWGADQLLDQPCVFYACYPYDAVNTQIYERYFMVQGDQSSWEGYTASDLMTAMASVTPAEGVVNFRFAHRLTKMVIHIDNQIGLDIAQAYLGNVQLETRYDFPSSNWTWGQGDADSVISACKVVTPDGEEAWALILPPQQSWVKLILETRDGEVFVYDTDNSVYFEAARCYHVHVALDQTMAPIDFTSDVMDWLDGYDIPFYQEHPDSGNNESD